MSDWLLNVAGRVENMVILMKMEGMLFTQPSK